MRPTLEQVYRVLDSMAPFALAAGFDNSGLLCGDWEMKVSRILLCVDCTKEVAQEAIDQGCDLIVSHHPLIFPSINRIIEQDGVGHILRMLILGNIGLVAMHTNADFARGGLCDALATMFNLREPLTVEPQNESGDGYGRMGTVAPVTVAALAALCKRKLEANTVRYSGSGDRVVQRVAVLSGSGSSAFEAALAVGAQCVITGDVKYSSAMEINRKGLSVIDAGHYDTEKVILLPWRNHLQKRFYALQYEVDLNITTAGADIFTQV